MSDVKLTEQRDGYVQVWECEPPEEGRKFRVLEDEWSGVSPEELTRTIRAWEYGTD